MPSVADCITPSNSGEERPPTEKGPREEPRANNGADHAARAADILHRSGEHQPRDSVRNEAGRCRYEADSRQNDARGRRQDNVRAACLPCRFLRLSLPCVRVRLTHISREQLQDQHALSAEIGNAITSVPIGEQPDEAELDAELEDLEQEAMDERMVKTGFVPVGDQLDRLPAAGNKERKWKPALWPGDIHSLIRNIALRTNHHYSQATRQGRGIRRRSRAGQAACRNGYVTFPADVVLVFPYSFFFLVYACMTRSFFEPFALFSFCVFISQCCHPAW